MTDQEINLRIAELCNKPESCGDCDPCVGGRPDQCAICRIQNYCGSLDAMHEAEKTLSSEQRLSYAKELSPYDYDRAFESRWVALHTSSKVRAIAFLKVHGKWEK